MVISMYVKKRGLYLRGFETYTHNVKSIGEIYNIQLQKEMVTTLTDQMNKVTQKIDTGTKVVCQKKVLESLKIRGFQRKWYMVHKSRVILHRDLYMISTLASRRQVFPRREIPRKHLSLFATPFFEIIRYVC